MSKARSFIAFFVVILACETIEATDRFYSDITETSANGRFQFAATSPDNADGKQGAFQTNFTYRLTDTVRKLVLWERLPQKELSPCMAFVRDDGVVVIVDAWDGLKIFDLTGKAVGETNLLTDALTKEEYDNYVHDTTAGPMWKGQSRWYFFTGGSQHFFIIRPHWGRRILIDLSNVKPVQETPALQVLLDDEESAYAEAALKQAVSKCRTTKNDDARDDIIRSIDDAIQIAGQRKMKSMADTLRHLESMSTFSSSCIGGDDAPVGEISVRRYSYNSGRRLIQLALRRMGEKPGGYAVTVFAPERVTHDLHWAERETEEAKYQKHPLAPDVRVKRASKIAKGMSPAEVIQLIGPPDYVRDRWEYDLDGDSPSTLLIEWSERNRIRTFWQTRPALWQLGLRDDDN